MLAASLMGGMVLSSGCRYLAAGDAAALHPVASGAIERVAPCPTRCADSVDIVALGVGGVLVIPWRDTTQLVLTPPSFTNPSVAWTVFGNPLFGTRPDAPRIRERLRSMPGVGTDRLTRVRAVLVGHGHYDHLMDLPPMLPLLPNATVYGSSTVVNLIAPAAARRVAVDTAAARGDVRTGSAYAIAGTVRVHAITWEHAPNFGNYVVARGDVRAPRTSLPRGMFGWKLGRPYAYAIDLLDDTGAVSCRLFYHDSAADPNTVRNAAAAMRAMPAARRTIAIMTGANFDQAAGFPDILLAQLDPAHVVVMHWEDFFRSPDRPVKVVRGTDATVLRDRLERFVPGRWSAVTAGATIRMGC